MSVKVYQNGKFSYSLEAGEYVSTLLQYIFSRLEVNPVYEFTANHSSWRFVRS